RQLQQQSAAPLFGEQIVESRGERKAVLSLESKCDAALVARQLDQHVAMPLRQLGEIKWLFRCQRFQRRKRCLEPRDKRADAIELMVAQPRPLLGLWQRGGFATVQFAELLMEAAKLVCEPAGAGLRPGAA